MRKLLLALALLLCFASPAQAAIAHVNRVHAGIIAGATTVSTAATAHTAGCLLVASISWNDAASATFTSIVDAPANNTWIQAGAEVHLGTNFYRTYYAYNCLGHATNVVTVTVSASSAALMVAVNQFSGLGTLDPLHDSDSASGTGTAIATPALSTAAPETVIVASMIHNQGGAITNGTGYTLVNFNATGDGGTYFADEYQIFSDGATHVADASAGVSNGWGIVANAFKDMTGAAAVIPRGTLLGVGP